MEIGYPTDVKHVAHIGWDGQSGNAPSWMNEFKTASDLTIGNHGELRDLSTWSSQDFDQSVRQPVTEMFKDFPPAEIPKPSKKKKWKKTKSSSSPKSSSSSRSSRAAKSKSRYTELEPTTTNIQQL